MIHQRRRHRVHMKRMTFVRATGNAHPRGRVASPPTA